MPINKRKKLVILSIFTLLIIFIISCVLYMLNEKKDISKQLAKTKIILVTKLPFDKSLKEKRISNSDEIKEIIKIVLNGTVMPEGYVVPYRNIPHYKLKMLNKNNRKIVEINFYDYGKESSWILFDNNDTNYIIDGELLKKLIDY